MRFYIYADFNVSATKSYIDDQGNTVTISDWQWQLIHAPENFPTYIYGSPVEHDKAFAYNIKMDKEINRAGSLSFTIAPGHPLYGQIFPLGTTIALTTPASGTAIGHVLWIGRILTIEKTFNLEKNVTCEGALGFLNDIMVRPRYFFIASGEDANKEYKMPAVRLLDIIGNEYNTRAVQKRKITFGVYLPVENIDITTTELYDGCTNPEYVVNGQTIIADVIGTKAKYAVTISHYNAYIWNGEYWEDYVPRSGYINDTYYTSIEDYVTTLDKVSEIANLDPRVGMIAECVDDTTFEIRLNVGYLPSFYNQSHIVFANNLTDIVDNGDGMDIYTAVIPFGKNKLRLNQTSSYNSTSHVTTGMLEGYHYWIPVSDTVGGTTAAGYIEKTIDYSDCETSAELASMAEVNLQAYQGRYGKSFNVSAVDLSIMSEISDEGYVPLIITDPSIDMDATHRNSDFNPDTFINVGDGVNIKDDVHGVNYTLVNFICSSMSLDIDNPGASNYTFQIYDESCTPLKPKMLTSYYDKRRAINAGKIAEDGTIYSSRQPSATYKEDENSVYTETDLYQEHYTAEGEGHNRTNIQSEKVAPGTYTPEEPEPTTP